MSQIKLESNEAIKNVEDLIKKLEDLNVSLMKIKKGSNSFTQFTTAAGASDKAVKKLRISMDNLVTSTDKNTDALNKNANSATKLKSAYKELKAAQSEALGKMRDLVVEGKKGSAEYQALAGKVKVYNDMLKKVSNTINSSVLTSHDKLIAKQQQQRKELQRLIALHGRESKVTKDAAKAYNNTSREVKKNSKAYDELTGKIKKVTKETKSGTKANVGFFKGMQKGIGVITGVIAALGVLVSIAKNVFNLAVKFDSLSLALKFTADSAWEAGESMRFLLELNRKFGAALGVTSERWLKFRTAAKLSGLTMLETERIFKSVTKASAVLGLQTDELKGIYLALEQMLNKGKVTTEELRRQLGERLPGAVGIMAASLGVSLEKLDEMLKKGKVLSAEVLPNFAIALEKAYGIEQVDRIDNLATSVNTLKGAWDSLILTIVEGDSPISKSIKAMTEAFTNILNSFNFAFMNNDQIERTTSGLFDIENLKKYEDAAESLLGNETKRQERLVKNQEAIAKKLVRITREIGLETNKEKKKILENEYNLQVENSNNVLAEIVIIEKRKQQEMHISAVAQLETARKAYKDLKEISDNETFDVDTLSTKGKEYVKAILGVNPAGILSTAIFGDTPEENLKDYFDDLGDALQKTVQSKSFLDITEKLAESKKIRKIGGDKDGDDKYTKRARALKEYAESNYVLITQLKERIKWNQELSKTEEFGIKERTKMNIDNANDRARISDLELEDKLKAIEVERKNRVASWDTAFSGWDKSMQNYKLMAKNTADSIVNINEEAARKIEKANVDAQKSRHKNLKINEKETEDTLDADYRAKLLQLQKENVLEADALKRRLDLAASGTIAEMSIRRELQVLIVKYHNQRIALQIERLQNELKFTKSLGQQLDIIAQITIAKGKLIDVDKNGKPVKDVDQNIQNHQGEGSWEYWMQDAFDIQNELASLTNAIFDRRIQQIQEEIDAETDKYDKLLELAKNDEAETKIIQRNKALALEKLEKKKRQEQIKQAKFNKAISISEATQALALAIVQMLTAGPGIGFALAAIAAGIGAIQVATIAAQPIPSFAKGGVMGKDGTALINDGGNLEFIERGGSILTSSSENALVPLKQGDVIHKDYNAMIRDSLVLNGLIGGSSEVDSSGIEDAIERGFKKAKNTVNVSLTESYNDYRNEMTIW